MIDTFSGEGEEASFPSWTRSAVALIRLEPFGK